MVALLYSRLLLRLPISFLCFLLLDICRHFSLRHFVLVILSSSLVISRCDATFFHFLGGEFDNNENSSFIYISYYLDNISKWLWLNGYRRRKWTRWAEFKSRMRLFEFHLVLIPLGKELIELFSLHLWINNWAEWAL